MTGCEVQASGAIELFFYGELTGAERAATEQHVRSCGDCRRALDDLFTIREALAGRPDIASPPRGDWSAFMARLDEAVSHEGSVRAAAPRTRRSVGGDGRVGRVGATPVRRTSHRPYLALAAVLTLVTIAVLLLARQQDEVAGPVAEHPVRSAGVAGTAPLPEPVDPALTAVGEQHFERSKLVVLGLATKDPDDRTVSNWAYEQQLASALLTDTRLYRMAAEERGMTTLAGVMRDLELLLLEASMSEQPDAESLATLQRLIRRRDLLTKMDVVKTSGL